GVRYRPVDRLAVEGAFVYQQWSRYDTVVLTPQDITVTLPGMMAAPIPQIPLQKSYKDTYSARLGVEGYIDIVTLRAGAFFETSATNNNRFDISTPDTNKIGLAAGASVKLWKFWLDAAYVGIMAPAVSVNDSQKTTVPIIPGGPAPSTIGNGTYNFGYHMV